MDSIDTNGENALRFANRSIFVHPTHAILSSHYPHWLSLISLALKGDFL